MTVVFLFQPANAFWAIITLRIPSVRRHGGEANGIVCLVSRLWDHNTNS